MYDSGGGGGGVVMSSPDFVNKNLFKSLFIAKGRLLGGPGRGE